MRMILAVLSVLAAGPAFAQTTPPPAQSSPPPVATPANPPGDGSGTSTAAPNTTESGAKSTGTQNLGGGKTGGTGN